MKIFIAERQIPDDYKELLEFTIITLGEIPSCGVKFKKPGAYHRAIWMTKLIYSMNIFMFKNQFNISLKEAKRFEDISRFAIAIYTKHWFSAPKTVSTPQNDLLLLKELYYYKEIN